MFEMVDWFQDRYRNNNHFSARFVGFMADFFGMDSDTFAHIFLAVSFLIFTFSDQAYLLANSLLVVIPLLLIFVFPEEKPSDESFLVYFPVLGGITVFDRSLESIPCYYVLKIVFFLLLFSPPLDLGQRIADLFNQPTEVSQKSSPKSWGSSSTRTAIGKATSPRSEKTARQSTFSTSTPSPKHLRPQDSDVKVTVIEEYYREEELLSPNGTVIDRVVTGPFRRQSYRMESKSSSAKSPT